LTPRCRSTGGDLSAFHADHTIGLRWVAANLAVDALIALLLAFGMARGVANLLCGVRPDNPAVFRTISAAITSIALLASWLPARRAAHIDPLVALRDK
jgi:ABC-type antimicrobial peptide transport system permease subunit